MSTKGENLATAVCVAAVLFTLFLALNPHVFANAAPGFWSSVFGTGIGVTLAGGSWMLYIHWLEGAGEWIVNLEMAIEYHPCSTVERLVLVRVKSKNPSKNRVIFSKPADSFVLTLREFPMAGLFDPEECDVMCSCDLIRDSEYDFMPGAEFSCGS